MMDLSTGTSKLSLALKNLRLQWEETKGHWSDAVARDFEEKQIHVLDQQTLDTLREMDRLAQVMSQARRECS
jgi:hypothetical protein